MIFELCGGRRDGIRIQHDSKVPVPAWLAFPVDIVDEKSIADEAFQHRIADRYQIATDQPAGENVTETVIYVWKERRPVPLGELFSATADRIL